ncbi:MAG TPA: ThiF family adenylyltransferase [Myxococcaceae bacterium]|nr:ThiF family adenylyltransferase [Myxococcaceae bacterium]
MSLSDGEIVRYSRQILLREVGGRGQERLLASAVALGAGGAALSTAAAYLAASGIRVLGGLPSEAGFLLGFADSLDFAMREDSRVQSSHPPVWLAEAPAHVPEEARSRVVIGGVGSAAEIVFGSAATEVRLLRAAAPLGRVPPALAETVGALAALVVQRLILGLGDPVGRLRVDPTCTVELRALDPSA